MNGGLVKVHAERCVACKRCVMNCAIAHSRSKTLFEAINEVPAPRPRVKLHQVKGKSVPTECRHCEAAACVLACPTGAMHKIAQGAPVLVDDLVCIGCQNCVLACPYGVPEAHLRGEQISKCDLCVDRLEAGLIPACVEACPTQCLEWIPTAQAPTEEAPYQPWNNLEWR